MSFRPLSTVVRPRSLRSVSLLAYTSRFYFFLAHFAFFRDNALRSDTPDEAATNDLKPMHAPWMWSGRNVCCGREESQAGLGDCQTIALRRFERNRDHEQEDDTDFPPEKTCFLVCPIGDDDSETRRRSDDVLKYMITPAIEKSGLIPIRADMLSSPGMITTQIITHILKDRLVIADLSEHNPNVFYEIALRHAFHRP